MSEKLSLASILGGGEKRKDSPMIGVAYRVMSDGLGRSLRAQLAQGSPKSDAGQFTAQKEVHCWVGNSADQRSQERNGPTKAPKSLVQEQIKRPLLSQRSHVLSSMHTSCLDWAIGAYCLALLVTSASNVCAPHRHIFSCRYVLTGTSRPLPMTLK